MMQTTLRRPEVGSLRSKIRGQWDVLSDEDIERAAGSLDRLIETIHARTGQPRPEIRRSLRRVLVS